MLFRSYLEESELFKKYPDLASVIDDLSDDFEYNKYPVNTVKPGMGIAYTKSEFASYVRKHNSILKLPSSQGYLKEKAYLFKFMTYNRPYFDNICSVTPLLGTDFYSDEFEDNSPHNLSYKWMIASCLLLWEFNHLDAALRYIYSIHSNSTQPNYYKESYYY